MPPSEERIPVLIIAGFLGAGKTTFIRELIPRLAQGTRAPYVILNDILNASIDASIDASTLKGLGAEIKELAAGCVCCDETTGLVDAILQVPVSIRPLIIIEANGTTDPYRLIETLTLSPVLRDRIGPIPHSHHHVAVSLTPPEMSEDRLCAWLLSLPRDILRVKGFVRISEEEMCYFSRTDDPFESPRIIRTTEQKGMKPAVVFIGTGLREDYLRESFQSTEAAPAFRLL